MSGHNDKSKGSIHKGLGEMTNTGKKTWKRQGSRNVTLKPQQEALQIHQLIFKNVDKPVDRQVDS